jgi:hypothetical protein
MIGCACCRGREKKTQGNQFFRIMKKVTPIEPYLNRYQVALEEEDPKALQVLLEEFKDHGDFPFQMHFICHGTSMISYALREWKRWSRVITDDRRKIITMLVKAGDDIMYPDDHSCTTPLHVSVAFRDLDFCKLLVELGASPCSSHV